MLYHFCKNLIVIGLSLSFSCSVLAQEDLNFKLCSEIHPVHNLPAFSKHQLKTAATLIDLNSNFEISWIKEFKSVEISAIKNGNLKNESGKNDLLTSRQKSLLLSADEGSEVRVKVLYIPDNTLTLNDIKEMSFSFFLGPEIEAKYSDDPLAYNAYFQNAGLDKIPSGIFKKDHLTAIRFTINQKGEVVNPEVVSSSGNNQADNTLLKVLCDMSNWIPASYASGQSADQDFMWIIGDKKSCTINLLNIHPN